MDKTENADAARAVTPAYATEMLAKTGDDFITAIGDYARLVPMTNATWADTAVNTVRMLVRTLNAMRLDGDRAVLAEAAKVLRAVNDPERAKAVEEIAERL